MRFVTVAATVLLSLFSFATVSVGAQQPLRTVIVQESVTSAEALCAASEASSNLQMDPSLENTYKLIFHAPKSAVVPDFVEAHWSVIPLAGANPQDSATVSYNVRVAGTGVLSQSPDSTIVQEGVVIPAAHSIQFYHTYGINDIQCETQIKKYTVQAKEL